MEIVREDPPHPNPREGADRPCGTASVEQWTAL